MPRRMIDTAIWSDARVTELEPQAMLVYLRLILGDDTGPAGATRVTPKRIAVDTNLTREQVTAALAELTAAGLVREYDGGWLWLPAFIRYQLSGPHFIRGIRRQAAETPEALNRAITRALDAIVGPGTEQKAEKRADRNPPPPDGPPTGKAAPSRQEIDSPTRDHGQTIDSPTRDHGLFEREVQDQDQDQDQDRPIGLSVLVPDTATPEAATPTPALGAQAPPPISHPPRRNTPTDPDALVPLHQLMRDAPPAFLRPLVVTPGDA